MAQHVCSGSDGPMPCRRLVQDGQELVYGPTVVSDRIATEAALLNATRKFLEPYGISNRYTNYTTHPSQTPGWPAGSSGLHRACKRPDCTRTTYSLSARARDPWPQGVDRC